MKLKKERKKKGGGVTEGEKQEKLNSRTPTYNV